MKKHTKQMLALLLALCTLVSVAMPTVFATQGAGEEIPEEKPADLTVNFKTAFENAGVAEFTYMQNAVSKLNGAYETNKWTLYCGGTTGLIKPNNLYAGGRYRGNYLEITNNNISANGATATLPTVFTAPGTGEYRLSVDYGIAFSGERLGAEMGAYILEMPATHYTKYNVPGPNASNILTKASVQMPEAGGKMIADNKVTLQEGVEYILVFYVISPDTTASYAEFNGFSLNYEPREEGTPEDLSVNFKTAFENAGVAEFTYMQNAVSKLNGAYETNKWTLYCGGTTGLIKPNNLYAGGRYRGNYLEITNNNISANGATATLPTVFTAPGTGEYRLSVDYGIAFSGERLGAEMGAYILPMPATHYTKYNIPGPNASNILTKAFVQNPEDAGTMTAENTVVLRKGVEYILVFYVISPDMADSYGEFSGFVLTFENLLPEETVPETTAPEETTVPVETTVPEETTPETPEKAQTLYQFYTEENRYVKLRENAAQIKADYDQKRSNWRFEAADSGWQFRLPGDSDQKSGTNIFNPEYNSLQYVTGASNSSNTRFFAVRIQSPGEGKYDLTFTHGAGTAGAKKASVYIVDAAVIDAALGENAERYAQAMADNLYANEAYTPYKAAIIAAIKDKKAVMTTSYLADAAVKGLTVEGRYGFAADKEYVMIITSDIAGTMGNIYLTSLAAVYSDDQSEDADDDVPKGPGYTDGVYDFNQIIQAGNNMKDARENLATMYAANTLNWKYEAKGGGLDLNKVAYHSATDSVRAISAKNWWLAVRIKAPSQDGQYDIKMVHGATSEGAPAGSIFVIPGDTPTNQIFKIASKRGPVTTTNWNFGEKSGDAMKGRISESGTVNLKAGQEYIVVFLPTEASPLNGNGCFYMGQLQLTRTGEYVEEDLSGSGVDGVEYEFYDWDYPGHFLNHYKTEEQLGKKILTKQIAEKYAAGEMNWCHFSANGFANFSTGTPYLSIGVGETHYYVLKIKAPGTGTYEITYNHLAMKDSSAAPIGGVYILPYEEGITYATIRDEANFKDPVITTNYSADKTTEVQKTGTYTAFQEGKEYLICFSADDTDVTEVRTLRAFPVSMVMKRIGDYKPEADGSTADGIVYKLALKEFAGKAAHTGEVYNTIKTQYENGTSNWKIESGVGSTRFYSKYLQLGTGSAGKCWAVRIKSPGTGTYKVTLDYIKNFAPSAANKGEIYIVEAPEKTVGGADLNGRMVQLPVMEIAYNCSGTRMQRASANGTYGFVEGKEYLVIFYGQDDMDKTNTVTSTYMYVDRLVMKRIGDYTEPEKALNKGGIVAENVLTQFKSEGYMLTQVNGHDYLVFTVFGGTMLIYDLDEWRLIDEVKIGMNTPRSICQDLDGNWWIAGGSQSLYCYNPYTREGFLTSKISSGGDHFEIVCDPEDGSLYFAAYTDNGIIIYRVNPKTLEVKSWQMESWSRYPGPGSCSIRGDYLYTTATSGDRCEVWKVDKRTGQIVDRVDMRHRTKGERYVYYMSCIGDNHLLLNSAHGVTVCDTRDMTLLYDDAVGLRGNSVRIASQPIDGKSYFVTNVEGLCYFDLETETFGTVGGELANYKTGLRVANLATIDDSRLTEETMIAFGGMTASGVSVFCINLETKTSIELIGLVEPGMGTGVNAHTLFKGEPGTNEIIYGPMYPDFPARVYNAATGELARTFYTKGQNDSYVWYNGKMYFGNYSSAILCEMNNGQATQLFTLNDKNFDQSRVHGICAGDNKVFIGTIPDNYVFGGMIAWYDLETGLSYVVTGPNPEDVYYAKASQLMSTNEWYSVVTGELVDMKNEWDNDNDGNGVYDHFKGPVPLQSIVHLNYSDGLLYGVSSLRGGSGAGDTPNATSVIFIYDVENMKMLKTVDVADYISGVPTTIRTIKSLNVDPDISNKLWGMVAETLFSMTYNRETNKVTIKEEISFNKTRVSKTSAECTEIAFDGDYMYVLFGPIGGLLKVNRNDTSDYTKVMGDFETTGQVPSSFILGDDGDIYYISRSSPHIYVLNVDITDEERASAKAVEDAINLIPENITLADRATVEAARAAWDTMPKANQPLVPNLEKLENAEIALLKLRIDALSDNVTIDDEAELMAIRAEYMALDLNQRLSIDFIKVSDAESKMSILRGERTSNLIAAIGEVTLEKEQQIRDARASFMALSRYERTLVTNVEILNTAEAALTGLLLKKNEAAAVDKKIEKIGFVFFGDGAKISAARKAYNKLDDSAKALVEKHGTLIASEIILVAEYVIAAAVVTGGVLYVIPGTRAKIFKKKEKATEE